MLTRVGAQVWAAGRDGLVVAVSGQRPDPQRSALESVDFAVPPSVSGVPFRRRGIFSAVRDLYECWKSTDLHPDVTL
jgi:hypothetical protein